MKLTNLLHLCIALVASGADAASNTGNKSPLSFGQHYAVLNLDMVEGVVSMVATSQAGQAFVNSTVTWIDAVHKQSPPPLSIFSTPYFSNTRRPEIRPGIPFYGPAQVLGNATASSPIVQIYHAFKPLPDYDIVMQKTRYYAGAGNALEEILSTQGIDTVVMSGLSLTGVVVSTAYRLFDLNYRVIVISNNTLQPGTNGQQISDVILGDVFPSLPIQVVTLEEALAALNRSGPAVY